MAYVIKVNGERIEAEPANGKNFTLAELQEAVGGYVEHLRLPGGDHLWLNEEGKLRGLQRNERATLLAKAAGVMPDDYVVGDVLVCEDRFVLKDED